MNRHVGRTGKGVIAVALGLACAALPAHGQGSRKDDIVFGPSGHPVAGATVKVCLPIATGTPCSPLATIYTDATLTVAAANPFQADGIGNYHFYAPPGRYQVQVSGPNITGTITYPDVILPADLSSSGSGNNISAFGLTLGGNLTVAGNASVAGTLTTGVFSPGTFSPATVNVGGNESVLGPRPRVDVTAYGAKGDGQTDDTAAIQAAINASCANATFGGSIFFPPTPGHANIARTYLVSQPQTPSTAPVFNLPCIVHLIGGSTSGAQAGAFTRMPKVQINVTAGASPNDAGVFQVLQSTASSSTFENLAVVGYNRAFEVLSSVNVTFKNTSGTVAATGHADNCPYVLKNVFWTWLDHIQGQAADQNHWIVCAVGDTSLGGETPLFGLAKINDMTGVGCPFSYTQRVNTSGSGPGDWMFDNISVETCNQDLISIQNTTGNAGSTALPQLSEIYINHVTVSDSSCGLSCAVLGTDTHLSGSVVQGVHIIQSYAGQAGHAIRMNSGTLRDAMVFCTGSLSVCQVTDGGNNLISGAIVQNAGSGLDYVGSGSVNSGRTDLFGAGTPQDAAPIRLAKAGAAQANAALDPGFGLAFGDATNYGFQSGILQNAPETLDVQFSNFAPPTNVMGTPTAGGSLANGTYYYTVRATNTSCSGGTIGAPSAVSAPITLSGVNGTINVSWTLPATSISAPTGYCVMRGTTPASAANGAGNWYIVSGGSTISYADTGAAPNAGSLPFTNTFSGAHRFTPTSLGVNTTSPQFGLDVNGTAAVNSLNQVQKAERFAGADAAARVNACLTAAASSSSLCDARGMVGALTGATRISIPAGTTLLWGQGQLTITDSTNNDAVELAGDGASIYGYQESGISTLPNMDTSGYIACATAGCTTVKKPNQGSSKINYVHIVGMYLQANGANSKVIDVTSIGHSVIESNNLALGSGGNSFGVFGDTSTGGFDATNTLIRHNNVGLNSTGDTCFSFAGVYNAMVIEQNVCTLAPGASSGYVIKKDSNGNYPNNDLIYGNDCESSSAAFGQICFNIVGALSVTIGPNNRCEKVYNCLQFPIDGSANGIHVIDPYLSLSNTNQVNPNEPATATVAIDNNGHNWLPSMHYGMNDLAGPNLLGNSGFEGWQNTTSLYYWGGVNGTNINQAGSGIYLQETSAGSNPGVDTYTQGTYNVRVGDGATAGLGVNSGCIQVDALREYTFMARVASGLTSNNFRPGFRFYWDANCTEADRITTASANARMLSPANYAGTSTSTGNWQSTNASLTYNNGITCNCNVTGADWQVATANAWTPTRNFGVIFRVPNAYSLSTTVTHSMRVFLLENTAAANNYVYFDDAVLSQGPVTTEIRPGYVRDSGGSAVYGSLAVSQHLNQGASGQFAGTVALVGGTATVTFPTPFASTPVCVANDQSAIATVRVQPSTTSVMLTQSSGTDTIAWMCIGNPN
jgi:hypothetical protein